MRIGFKEWGFDGIGFKPYPMDIKHAMAIEPAYADFAYINQSAAYP
jgi:hypothetical protein